MSRQVTDEEAVRYLLHGPHPEPIAEWLRWCAEEADRSRLRHPVTGRFMAGDCERDCLDSCAGLCGATT